MQKVFSSQWGADILGWVCALLLCNGTSSTIRLHNTAIHPESHSDQSRGLSSTFCFPSLLVTPVPLHDEGLFTIWVSCPCWGYEEHLLEGRALSGEVWWEERGQEMTVEQQMRNEEKQWMIKSRSDLTCPGCSYYGLRVYFAWSWTFYYHAWRVVVAPLLMCSSLKSDCACAGERCHYRDFRVFLITALQYGICAPFFSWEYPNRCILWSCLSIFMVVSQTCLTVILWLTSAYTQVHSSIPSFRGGRSQFSVFKFFKLLAVCSLAIAFAVTTGVCKRRKSGLLLMEGSSVFFRKRVQSAITISTIGLD